jgi:hypothetical protein
MGIRDPALMLIVGLVSGIGLWLLKVPNFILFGILRRSAKGSTSGSILSAIPPMPFTRR